jgi:hypothetical protein
MSVELELAFAERCLQPCEELAAEDAAEHLDREEEGAARRDPAQVIWSQATCSDDAVHMRMMLQPLVPGMEHAEEADLRTEVPRVASDLLESFGAGAKEQAVQDALVLEGKRSQLTREREDGVYVASGQQLPFTLLEPAQAGVALASWAMPVAARVIGDGSVSAVRALIAMAAQCSGATARDRIEYLQVLPVDPAMTAFCEAITGVADDVGHLERGAA